MAATSARPENSAVRYNRAVANRRGQFATLAPALAAPLLFGLGTVASKPLLSDMPPALLAGVLYLGAGLGLGAARLMRPRAAAAAGTALKRADLPWLAGATVCGGVIGPLLLMLGLAGTAASVASLLLILETAFTACLAWTVFGERATARLALGIVLALVGGAALSWPDASSVANARWHGSALVAAACLAWGFDNNLSQRISSKDPVSIAAIKGLVAGSMNVALAVVVGTRMPAPILLAEAGLLGFLSYGVSLVCFILSLRRLGSARTSLYFALAPFFGAAAGILFLHDPVSPRLALGGGFMAAAALFGLQAPSES